MHMLRSLQKEQNFQFLQCFKMLRILQSSQEFENVAEIFYKKKEKTFLLQCCRSYNLLRIWSFFL